MPTILIAVDGSEASLAAVRQGVLLVQNGLRAAVALVNVQKPASLLELATHDADAIAAAAVEAGEHLMQAGVALLAKAQVTYTTEVVLGEPALMLVDMADQVQADWVILGAHGTSAIRRAWLGSVSQEVLSRCTKPVLIVRLPEDAVDQDA